MNDCEWLNGLKVGDKVIASATHAESVATVTKVTPTQIVCGHSRFRKKDGRRLGDDGWQFARLVKLTQERADKIHAKSLANKLTCLRRDDLERIPLDVLRQIVSLIDTHTKEQPK